MAGYNKVTILGNITRDLELRYTPSGMAVCDICIAVTEKRKNGEETLFIDCTAWDKTAELAVEYLAKGRQVLFEGRLKLDQWNDKESGKKRSKISMTIDKMVFVGNNGENVQQQQSASQMTPQQLAQQQYTPEQQAQLDTPTPNPAIDDVPF